MNRHVSVLPEEVVAALSAISASAAKDPVVLDGTLGGAGHSEALLEKIPNLRLLASDLDQAAIDAAKVRLAKYVAEKRVSFYLGNFADLAESAVKLENGFQPPWSGILLDLGYSSNQLESSNYGMSFMIDGPLDMRLTRPVSGVSAWELIEESSVDELADVFRAYGETAGASRLARIIKGAMDSGELENSTKSLAGLLTRITPGAARAKIHPATKIFQALRIAVNDELRNLDRFLKAAILNIRPGGRVAVITFHSLEDRIVKRWGQENASSFRVITKKPQIPSEQEIQENPRSRSAKLRVYEKTG